MNSTSWYQSQTLWVTPTSKKNWAPCLKQVVEVKSRMVAKPSKTRVRIGWSIATTITTTTRIGWFQSKPHKWVWWVIDSNSEVILVDWTKSESRVWNGVAIHKDMDFFIFSGLEDPLIWLHRCKKFLSNQRARGKSKGNLVASHMMIEAQLWYY